MVHPSERIRGKSSSDLAGKRIILGVAGSIAAVKTVELARELIRHGADVVPVMTPAAAGIIHPDALRFATGHQPITCLSGDVEHVAELGVDGDADLMLVAPATGNTVAKMALGIDDTALTTFAAVALGAKRPILIAPAMHGVMEENPATRRHIDALRETGVRFIRPLYEEDKAKLAPIDHIVSEVRRALGPASLAHRRVVVITGAAQEPIDPVRVITNRSSGRMGRAIALEAWRRGADVVVLDASGSAFPSGIEVHRFVGVSDLIVAVDALVKKRRPDAVLVPAALSDFAPARSDSKLSSDDGPLDLQLTPVPKVLSHVRAAAPETVLVGWKLEDDLDKAIERAKARRAQHGADLMVANGRDALGADTARCVIVGEAGDVEAEGSKDALAHVVLDAVEGVLAER